MSRRLLLLFAALCGGCEFDVAGAAPQPDGAGFEPPDAASPGTPDAPTALADAAPADALAPSTDARPLSCPSSYTIDPATTTGYRLAGTTFGLDWRTAETVCAGDGTGTHLAVIQNGAELERVKLIVGGASAWVGVSDRVTEGDFLWVTGGTASFLPWAAGEPNDDGLFGEDCVELKAGLYNDHGCSNPEAYLCECDGVAEDANAF